MGGNRLRAWLRGRRAFGFGVLVGLLLTAAAVGKTGNARHPWISSHLHLEVARQGEVIDPSMLGLPVLASASNPEETHGRGGE